MPIINALHGECVWITKYPWSWRSWVEIWKWISVVYLDEWSARGKRSIKLIIMWLLTLMCWRKMCLYGEWYQMYRYVQPFNVWQPATRGGRWWGGWLIWKWNRPWWKWGRWKLCYRLWLAYYFYDISTLFNITLVERLFTIIVRKCQWWRVEIVRWKIFLFKTFIKVYPFIKDNLLKPIVVFCYIPIKFHRYPKLP